MALQMMRLVGEWKCWLWRDLRVSDLFSGFWRVQVMAARSESGFCGSGVLFIFHPYRVRGF